MRPQPQRYIGGQALRADILNQILDTLRRSQPIAGTGVMVRHSSNGTIISVQPKRSVQRQREVLVHPFKVTVVRDETGDLTAEIYTGRVFKITESTDSEEAGSSRKVEEVKPELSGLSLSATEWKAV